MNSVGVVMILEDNPGSGYYIAEALKKRLPDNRHNFILNCSNISDANDQFRKNKNNLKCIACDSNMSPIGLNEDDREKSENGLYSGWLWLFSKVRENPSLTKVSILYTAYYDEIKAYIDEHPDQKEIFLKIHIVNKRTISDQGADELINTILQILNKNDKEDGI